jgi:Holliday junction resolvasome RuvABC endonuclease subunit
MVASILRLDTPIASEDACDALAIAICHATRGPRAALEVSA